MTIDLKEFFRKPHWGDEVMVTENISLRIDSIWPNNTDRLEGDITCKFYHHRTKGKPDMVKAVTTVVDYLFKQKWCLDFTFRAERSKTNQAIYLAELEVRTFII